MLKAFFLKSCGMTVVTKHLEHLKYMQNSVEEVAKKIVLDNIDVIIQLIQDNQLGKGMYYDGSLLKWKSGSGLYHPMTQAIATRDGAIRSKPAGQPYNFEWTGDTFSSMGVKVGSDNTFDIFTRAGKQRFLEETYGEKLFHLSEENNKILNDTIIEFYLTEWIEDNWWKF
jgi:hypothetical protein